MDVNCLGRSSLAAALIWILGILRPGVGLKLFVTDSGPNIEGPRKLLIELFDYSDGKKKQTTALVPMPESILYGINRLARCHSPAAGTVSDRSGSLAACFAHRNDM